jgi:hypothetical protein
MAWITNGMDERRIDRTSSLPANWDYGRKPITASTRNALSKGAQNALQDPLKRENMLRGLELGRTRETGIKGANMRWKS